MHTVSGGIFFFFKSFHSCFRQPADSFWSELCLQFKFWCKFLCEKRTKMDLDGFYSTWQLAGENRGGPTVSMEHILSSERGGWVSKPILQPNTCVTLSQASYLHPVSAQDALQGSLWPWCCRNGHSSKQHPGPWKDVDPSLGAPQSSGPACRILDVEMGNDLGPFAPVAVWLHPLRSGSLGPPHISMCLGAPWRVTAGTPNPR